MFESIHSHSSWYAHVFVRSCVPSAVFRAVLSLGTSQLNFTPSPLHSLGTSLLVCLQLPDITITLGSHSERL